MEGKMVQFRGIIVRFKEEIIDGWIEEQRRSRTLRVDIVAEREIRAQSSEFLDLFVEALGGGNLAIGEGPEWDRIKIFLKLASSRSVVDGFTPVEATSVLISLKQPLFALARKHIDVDPREVCERIGELNAVLDKLALYVMESFLEKKEEVIARQREEIEELSTPVVQIWEGILILPLIGTLDSRRTQDMMERLLEMIVRYNARVTIIDITGVPAVDTLVAQHLLKTVAAAKLMGTECMISGISPAIAQTIVHLGVNVGDVRTEYRLYEAFRKALSLSGYTSPAKIPN